MKADLYLVVLAVFMSCTTCNVESYHSHETAGKKKIIADTIDQDQILFRSFLGNYDDIVPIQFVSIVYRTGGVKIEREHDSSFSYYSKPYNSQQECLQAMGDLEERDFPHKHLVIDYKGVIKTPADFIHTIWP